MSESDSLPQDVPIILCDFVSFLHDGIKKNMELTNEIINMVKSIEARIDVLEKINCGILQRSALSGTKNDFFD